MASYSIVLAPIAALMAFDFFVIKHARIDIYQLYRPTGIYRFTGGWNWRAFTALLIAVVPNLPGMINAIDATVRRGFHSRLSFGWWRPQICLTDLHIVQRVIESDESDWLTRQIKIGDIKYLYMLSNVTGDAIALLVYYALNRFFPAHGAQVEVAVHDTKLNTGESAGGSEEDVGGHKLDVDGEAEAGEKQVQVQAGR